MKKNNEAGVGEEKSKSNGTSYFYLNLMASVYTAISIFIIGIIYFVKRAMNSFNFTKDAAAKVDPVVPTPPPSDQSLKSEATTTKTTTPIRSTTNPSNISQNEIKQPKPKSVGQTSALAASLTQREEKIESLEKNSEQLKSAASSFREQTKKLKESLNKGNKNWSSLNPSNKT